jgi:hypothetical protein
LGFQNEIADLIPVGFDGRVQDKPVARNLRQIFDFSRIPLQPSAQSHELFVFLRSGAMVTSIKFCSCFYRNIAFLNSSAERFSPGCICERNQERFTRLKDKNSEFKGRVLVLNGGGGSVYEELSSRSGDYSKPIPLSPRVADATIEFMWQTCCGERTGSHISRVKSIGQTGLGDETFDSHALNSSNMPHLHEIDCAAIVNWWLAEGCRMGPTNP